MFKRAKQIKKLEKSTVWKEATERDHDKYGRAIIEVGLKEADEFYSPYSYRSYEFMNPEVADYINMCEASVPVHEELAIDIYTETDTTNEDKKRIRRTVKRHHAEQLVVINKKLRKNLVEGLIFCILGFIILFVEAMLYSVFANMYLDTILAVVGWLFLWDGIEIIVSDRNELVRRKLRSLRLLNAKVHVRKYSLKIQREYGFGEFEDDEDDDEDDE